MGGWRDAVGGGGVVVEIARGNKHLCLLGRRGSGGRK